MCGIAGIFGNGAKRERLEAMIAVQHHRGPDSSGIFSSARVNAMLGHNRLSIIDLSAAGNQPMSSHDGRLTISFNGEIYNYLELRAELAEYRYHTRTDTEVILAAYEQWGEACLDHFIGMFAFAIWDESNQRLFAARDRFGVKPLNYHQQADGTLLIASEIKALHAAGVPAEPDTVGWSTYLTYGLYDHSERSFWRDVKLLPPGHKLVWENEKLSISCWYDVVEHSGEALDSRPSEVVCEEYRSLLAESIRLRFRSDVPVGINLSGGLDSSALFGLVQAVQGHDSDVKAFTYITSDPRYDELPWVRQMLEGTKHPSLVYCLDPAVVPEVAESVFAYEDEPFGGLATTATAPLFEKARNEGVIVLLDGQGMDEQWGGYDYYRSLDGTLAGMIQGTQDDPYRPECLTTSFRIQAEPFMAPKPYNDRLRNLQYRDIRYTKLPKALRFNDRVSMRASTELREPFLDHRLVELALRQPPERKILNGTSKVLLRQMARQILPARIVEAPKRPLQNPQREWLRGPLRDWANVCIEKALSCYGGEWLIEQAVRREWLDYCVRGRDNSFYVWQWISLGLMAFARELRRSNQGPDNFVKLNPAAEIKAASTSLPPGK